MEHHAIPSLVCPRVFVAQATHPTSTPFHARLHHPALAPSFISQSAQSNVLLPTANPRWHPNSGQPAEGGHPFLPACTQLATHLPGGHPAPSYITATVATGVSRQIPRTPRQIVLGQIDTKLLSYVSYPYDFEPRQEQKVWKAWWRCNLPSDLKDFVHALWERLPVGHRQANWKPLENCCPLDGSLETVRHSLLHCRYLPVAYDTIAKCFPDWGSGVLGIQRLIDSEPASSLQTPVGSLARTAIYASWLVRCIVKYHPEARHTFQFFLKRWLVVLRSLAQARCYTHISVDQIKLFIAGIQSLQHGALAHPSLIITPPPLPRPHRRRPRLNAD